MINQDCNKVKCELCGRSFRQITDTHLRKAHEITFAEYKQMFPNSATLPSDIHAALSEIATQKVADGIIGFHEGHTVNAGKTPWNKGAHGLQVSNRKGKTKYTDESVRKGAVSLSITRKRLYKEGKLKKLFGKDNPMYGKKLTEAHMAALWGGWKGPGTKAELNRQAGWDCVVVWEHEIMDDNYSIESLSNYL